MTCKTINLKYSNGQEFERSVNVFASFQDIAIEETGKLLRELTLEEVPDSVVVSEPGAVYDEDYSHFPMPVTFDLNWYEEVVIIAKFHEKNTNG